MRGLIIACKNNSDFMFSRKKLGRWACTDPPGARLSRVPGARSFQIESDRAQSRPMLRMISSKKPATFGIMLG
jgi:hypothetical protein